MKIFSYILLILFICANAGNLISQSAVPASPSKEITEEHYSPVKEITLKTVDSGKLKKFKDDPDFQYDRTIQYELTVWERIIEWIKSLLQTIFFTEEYSDLADIILYSVMGITVVTIILIIYRTEIRNIFIKDIKNKISYLDTSENIHELNFDEMIAKNLDEKNYRFALRLTYLQLLKVLDSRDYIKWRMDKTNRELIKQIKHKDLYAILVTLTQEFENVWYGGADLDENTYKHYTSAYHEIYGIVKLQP